MLKKPFSSARQHGLNKRHGRLFLAALFAQFLRGERDLKSKIAYRRRVCSCVPGCFLLIRLDCGMFTQLMDNPINGCPPSNAPETSAVRGLASVSPESHQSSSSSSIFRIGSSGLRSQVHPWKRRGKNQIET